MSVKQHRENLYAALPDNTLVISYAGIPLHRNEDGYYNFEVNSQFFYLTGLERLWIGAYNPVPAEQVQEMQRRAPKCEIDLSVYEDPVGGRWRYIDLANYIDTWVDTYHPRYEKLREQFGNYEYTAYNFTWNDPKYDSNYVPAATPAPAVTQAPVVQAQPQYQPETQTQPEYQPQYQPEYQAEYQPQYLPDYTQGYQLPFDPYQNYGIVGDPYAQQTPDTSEQTPADNNSWVPNTVPNVPSEPSVPTVPNVTQDDPIVTTLVPPEGEPFTIG